MSTSREITVWCDGGDPEGRCLDSTYGAAAPMKNAREARKSARKAGWTYRDGKDYCPEHSRRRARTAWQR